MKKLLIPALLITSLSACSSLNSQYQVPVPKDHRKDFQTQLQAAKHWDIVAEDVAKQAVESLKNQGLLKLPMSVKNLSNSSVFEKSLNQFVTTHMVNQGALIKVSTEESQKFDKMVLEQEIQVVKFKSDRSNRLKSDYTPGESTATAVGLVTLRNAVTRWSSDSLLAGAIGLGIARDAVMMSNRYDDSLKEIPNVEVIVHSSIIKDGIYVMRRSNAYYFNEPDKNLYNKIGNPVKVVGK